MATVMALVLLFSMTACSKDYADMTADDLIKDIKDQSNVTVDEYVNLASTYSNVKITEDLELEENITDEAIKKLIDNGAKLPSTTEYMGILLKSESPQVRGRAISNISSMLGADENNLALAKELIKTEKEPFVLYKATEALSNEGGADAEIGKFLMDMAKNENHLIRMRAAMALGNSWSKGIDGVVDQVIALMSDSNINVRRAAYRYAGKLGDEKVIQPIVEMLNNPDDAELHGDGIESLVKLWFDFPFHKNTSEAAYRATLDYLKKTPATDDIPAWTAVGSFNTISESNFDEWKKKATYYNPSEIVAIMTDLIKNPDVNSNARDTAIDVIKTHGTRADLEALKPVIDSLTDEDASNLQNAYKTALGN